ncbi:MAG: BON domain-containing protein [Planctomycetaceae bacterium]|nr:BON domain-containing protein [Planctomycetaceae bacterium]MCA9065991.1 BON domain-containing protein [Planctomycetaceae bacterium]
MVTSTDDLQRTLRIDPEHQLGELMQDSVSRMLMNCVDVMLQHDEVWLTGRVTSYHEKQLAQESVRSLAGKRRIRNLVAVQQTRR